MTLDEHEAQLKAEGGYEAVKARQERQEEERQRRVAEWRQAEKPLVDEINTTGLAVTSVWDLVNSKARHSAVIPILLDHLTRPYPERVREGIARALAVPESIVGWKILLNAFRDEKNYSTTGPKWALALALGAAGTDDVLDDVFPLLEDENLGRNRVPLLPVLGRSRNPRSRVVLNALKDDETIGKEVKKVLRRLQANKKVTMSTLSK
jgi:hypothetical protein